MQLLRALEFLSGDNRGTVNDEKNPLGRHVATFHRGIYPVHCSSSVRAVSPEKWPT